MKKYCLSFILLFSVAAVYSSRTIHVFVALCDNINQGIVKVPDKIGNGQDPLNNLYWGCAFGVKTFFKNSSDWKLIKVFSKPSSKVLERVLLKHKRSDTYLLADAYGGAEIKQCTIDMLYAAAGNFSCSIKADSITLQFGGASNLIAYIGHDGLMDFQLDEVPKAKNNLQRQVIILACFSKNHFQSAVRSSGATPLIGQPT